MAETKSTTSAKKHPLRPKGPLLPPKKPNSLSDTTPEPPSDSTFDNSKLGPPIEFNAGNPAQPFLDPTIMKKHEKQTGWVAQSIPSLDSPSKKQRR